jgi:hypothetical protein
MGEATEAGLPRLSSRINCLHPGVRAGWIARAEDKVTHCRILVNCRFHGKARETLHTVRQRDRPSNFPWTY